MNKAFVREPEFDGRAYCPHCGSLGVAVAKGTLDHHVQESSKSRLGDAAWWKPGSRGTAIFLVEQFLTTAALQGYDTPVQLSTESGCREARSWLRRRRGEWLIRWKS